MSLLLEHELSFSPIINDPHSLPLVSEGIATLLVTGPHLKGKQMLLKCDYQCLFLPGRETATATNNTVAMSFSVDSRPGDDWVNRLSFWKQPTDRNVMIISRVYGFPRHEPDRRETFSFHQKVLRAIESVFGRISWVNGMWFLLSLFSWLLTWEIGKMH